MAGTKGATTTDTEVKPPTGRGRPAGGPGRKAGVKKHR
jgi:hypothetical protein